MAPSSETKLSGLEYVQTLQGLLEAKRQSVHEVALRIRSELAVKIARLFTGELGAVRSEHSYPSSPEVASLDHFGAEMDRISDIINACKSRFSPHESRWHKPEEDRSEELVAISDRYNPQIIGADQARLRGLLAEIEEGATELLLTVAEQERLLQPLSPQYEMDGHLEHLLPTHVLLEREETEGGKRFEIRRVETSVARPTFARAPNRERFDYMHEHYWAADTDPIYEFIVQEEKYNIPCKVVVPQQREREFLERFSYPLKHRISPHLRPKADPSLMTKLMSAIKPSEDDFGYDEFYKQQSRYPHHKGTVQLPAVRASQDGPLLPIIHPEARAFALRTELFRASYEAQKKAWEEPMEVAYV
jgi:hypothetical protein